MRKIILSVAVATVALSTTAGALEDIKVKGQAKLWYETQDAGKYTGLSGEKEDNSFFESRSSSGEVVFKLGMTGKQGNVGFGTTMYQSSTMGLEGTVVGGTRTNNLFVGQKGDGSIDKIESQAMYVGEAYITAPIAGNNLLKFGKQELDTPMAFTERWNATPNTFNAAVLVNKSLVNTTLIAAYVGQGNATGWKTDGEVDNQMNGGAYSLAALVKTKTFGLNFWAYRINNVGGALKNKTTDDITKNAALTYSGGNSIGAYWLDTSFKAGPANVKLYLATVTSGADAPAGENTGHTGDATTAFALSVKAKAGPLNIFVAGSSVSKGQYAVANAATSFKKTKLPTAGVYTDGVFVAQGGSTALKVKVSGKAGSTGIAFQVVNNTNGDDDRFSDGKSDNIKDTTEMDLIVSQKLGDFNLKAMVINRAFANDKIDDTAGGTHFRLITAVNF
jgi:hypothetical protein